MAMVDGRAMKKLQDDLDEVKKEVKFLKGIIQELQEKIKLVEGLNKEDSQPPIAKMRENNNKAS